MKWKVILFVLASLFSNKNNAQWNKVSNKSKFVFQFDRFKLVENLKGYDTTMKKHERFEFTIDTIINRNNRKMFIFSKCLNALFFNSTCQVVNMNENKKLELLDEIPLIDNQKDYSPIQATIFYQVRNFIFKITVPNDFFKKFLRNTEFVSELDYLILNNIDTSDIENVSDNRIVFKGYSLPFSPVFELPNSNIESTNNDDDSHIYNFKKTMNSKSSFSNKKINLYELTQGSWIMGKLIVSDFGIIGSESIARSKKYYFLNIAKLSKME